MGFNHSLSQNRGGLTQPTPCDNAANRVGLDAGFPNPSLVYDSQLFEKPAYLVYFLSKIQLVLIGDLRMVQYVSGCVEDLSFLY